MTRSDFIAWWTAALVVLGGAAAVAAVPAFLIDRRNDRLWLLRTSARWLFAILLVVLALVATLPLFLPSSGRPM